MKKSLIIFALVFACSNIAFADSVFESNDIQQVNIKPISTTANEVKSTPTTAYAAEIKTSNFDSAISNLDSAQAQLREEYSLKLQKCEDAKRRLDAVKKEYNTYKSELNKTDKKIKELDKMKKKINEKLK